MVQVINREDELDISGVKRRNVDGRNMVYPLIITFFNDKDCIEMELTVNRDIIPDVQLNEILEQFQLELNQFMQAPVEE